MTLHVLLSILRGRLALTREERRLQLFHDSFYFPERQFTI